MWLVLTVLPACTPTPDCRADVQVWEDLDGDGYGAVELAPVCEVGAGQATRPLDCDDAAPDVNPEAREKCNGRDDDCDGSLDEGHDRDLFFTDDDRDGYGVPYPSVLACESPGNRWSRNDEDCDDADADAHPDAQETCRDGDEDCDGLEGDFDDSVDPTTYRRFYRDADLDAHGNPDRTTRACQAPPGYVPTDDDCDDADPNFSSNIYYADADDDGFGDPSAPVNGCTRPAGTSTNRLDCDDTDPDITNEHDWYEDVDGDGWGDGPSLGFGCTPPGPDLAPAPGDCDEADPDENPGTPEDCTDGLDQNCNGLFDCDDEDCVSDPTCVPPCADDNLGGPLPISVSGSTTGQGDDITPVCGFSTAPDVVFQYVPDASGTLTIDTVGSAFDTVLQVFEGCGGVSLGCNDDAVGLQSRVVVSVTAGVPIIIVVDGYSSGNGAYDLNVQ
jgi:hypothetical protein